MVRQGRLGKGMEGRGQKGRNGKEKGKEKGKAKTRECKWTSKVRQGSKLKWSNGRKDRELKGRVPKSGQGKV